MSEPRRFDIAIIGGGSGLTAAWHAQRDGRSVALIDARPEALGGTCVNFGCLPTKTLVQVADVVRTIRSAEWFGVSVDLSTLEIDFRRVMADMRAERKTRAEGVRQWVESDMTPFFSRARFVDDRLLETEEGDRIAAERVFLAVGARPGLPPIEGIGDVPCLTNESFLELEERPESVVIVGGGYIGCELGHVLAALGTRVTLVDASPKRLLQEDDEIGDLFTREFGRRVELVLDTRATAVRRRSGGGVGVGVGVEVDVRSAGGEARTIAADALLLAAGRTPNTDGLGLEATGVNVDERGWIEVDDHFRTSREGIYAYGDCIGRAMFKHTSSVEGGIAYRNAFGADEAVSYHANPHAVFSEPQIASVGMTEQACREAGLDYRAASVPYDGIAKGEIVGAPPGLAKAIVENGSDRILGFHLAGPHAAMLVHEVVVAMSGLDGGTVDAIRRATHIHPTMGELVQKVFDRL